MAEQYSTIYIVHISFFYSCVDGQLGSFHSLALVNNVGTDMGPNICVPFFNSFGIPKSGTGGSYVSMFNFLRYCQTVYRGCIFLCFHQQCVSVPTGNTLMRYPM